MKKFDQPPIHSSIQQNYVNASVWIDWFERLADTVPQILEVSIVIDPSSVSANSTSEQAITVSGVKTGDVVLRVQKPTYTSGLIVTGGLVTAANTITIQFANVTGSPIDPASETYKIYILRG